MKVREFDVRPASSTSVIVAGSPVEEPLKQMPCV
ncbi:MAG: hypothetical protein ACI81R_002667 [Bradymonadia bacterium]|jgi:hypothetical protein